MFHAEAKQTWPGHCIWCARKLRKAISRGPFYDDRKAKPRGDYGEGLFCGLRCGYQYGVVAAAQAAETRSSGLSSQD